MLVHDLRVAPSIKFGTHLYTWVERGIVRVKCLAQEHSTMSPARARTRTARSGVERTNHEATTPLTSHIEHNSHNLCLCLFLTEPFNSFILGSSSGKDDDANESKCVDTFTRYSRTQWLGRKKTSIRASFFIQGVK